MEKSSAPKEHRSSSLVPVLACVLNQLCVSNDKHAFSPKESTSKFHAMRIPYITLKEYLERIAKYSGCSSESLVLALVYIDRIIQGSQNFIVNSYSIHRLLITSVMLAAKFFDDQYYNNAYYAKVGGVSYSEMNALEVEFLFMLNFDLFVTTETYKQYYEELWSHANSTHARLCGCNKAKVPLLILPRFDEIRPTPQTIFDSSDDNDDQCDLDNIDNSPSEKNNTSSETTQVNNISQIPATKPNSKIAYPPKTTAVSPSFITDFIAPLAKEPSYDNQNSYFDTQMETSVSGFSNTHISHNNTLEEQKDHIMVDIRTENNKVFRHEEQKDFAWQDQQVPPVVGFYGNFPSFHEAKDHNMYDINQTYQTSGTKLSYMGTQSIQTWDNYQVISPKSQGVNPHGSNSSKQKRQNSKGGDMNFWQVLPVY